MPNPLETKDYEDEEYYHGLLPREDIPHLLKEKGDFIVRISQPKPSEPRQVIISVCVSRDQQKHYVVQQMQVPGKAAANPWDEPPIKYCVDGQTCFDSVPDLINHYLKKKMPLSKEHGAGVLIKNPIHRAAWELKHENVIMEKKLGEGTFGEVWLGKLKFEKTDRAVPVAIKVTKSEEINKEKIGELMKEARLMRNYDHNNVVKLWGVAAEKEPLMIVMEFVNGGALDAYLKKNKCEVKEKTEMCVGAALGVEYLHKKSCIHRDLAARNCLYNLGEEKVVKIADFGLSREGKAYQLTAARMVPVKWLAPETVSTLTYTQKSDVWSFGIMVWEIFADGVEPYTGITNGEAKDKILKGHKLEFPPEAPPKLVDLIHKDCWELKEDKRGSMSLIARRLEVIGGRHKGPKGSESQIPSKVESKELMPKSNAGESLQKGESAKKKPASADSRRRRRKK